MKLAKGDKYTINTAFDYLTAGITYTVTYVGNDIHFKGPNGSTFISKTIVKRALANKWLAKVEA